MKHDPDRLLPVACVAGLTSWLTALALRVPPGDGDLSWQRWLGERILREHTIPRALGPETFTANGAPWTPHEWLFSLMLAFTQDHFAGWFVPMCCGLAAGWVLTTVVARGRRRGVSSALCTAGVVMCSLAMLQSFGPRPQVAGWAGLATVLWILEMEGPVQWLSVPVTIAWANLHASALLAPFVAALFALTAALRDRRWSPAVLRSSAIAGACALGTLVTPLGIDLPRYALALLSSPIRHSIAEWGPTTINSVSFLAGAFPLVLLLAAFGARSSSRDRILACFFLVILFIAVRNVPVFAFATAPIALAALVLPRRQAELSKAALHRLASWTTVVAVSLAASAITVVSWRGGPARGSTLPYGPAHVLLHDVRSAPRVFCEDFAWCSLFLGDEKQATFFMDGRADPYPAALWSEYRDVIDGRPDWSKILDAHRVDAVLVFRDSALDSLLATKARAWRPIAVDRHARVYVRPAQLR